MLIEVGQLITLNMQVNNSGTVLKGHPYLVIETCDEDNYIEIAQVDSLEGKEYKAAKSSNKIIYCDNPLETVIDKDSYIQKDNSLRIEYFDELVKMRRQSDKLSPEKLKETIDAYKDYQNTHILLEDKQVYLTKERLIELNPKLRH